MHKITIEDLTGKKETRTIIGGDQYLVHVTDPNVKNTMIGFINASNTTVLKTVHNMKEGLACGFGKVDKGCNEKPASNVADQACEADKKTEEPITGKTDVAKFYGIASKSSESINDVSEKKERKCTCNASRKK